MDYPFHTARCGDISADLISRLKTLCESAPPTRHEGFNTHQYVERRKVDFSPELVKELTEAIGYFNVDSHYGIKVDVLAPGGVIHLHSDMSVASRDNIWICGHTHNIHIPLTTNAGCNVFHKRSHLIPDDKASKRHLLVGHSYAFNDYVHHWVRNDGETERIHLVVYYHDPKWLAKMALVKKFGLRLDQYYEVV
jgi:hypothetical protein